MKSKLFNLNLRDGIRGLIIAVIASILASLKPIIETHQLPNKEQLFNALIMGGLSGLISYLSLNFVTNSKGYVMQKDSDGTIVNNGFAKNEIN